MKEKMTRAADFIRRHCQADDFTLRIHHTEDLYTRFAQNAITQHIDGKNLYAHLEVAFDNRTGAAAVNQFDEESLKNLICKAENIAKLNKPDPEYTPSEKAHELRELIKPSAATRDLQVEKIVADIAKCIKNAEEKKAKVSGISEKKFSESLLLTKNGFEGYDQRALFSHSMTMKKGGIETKVSLSAGNHAEFSISRMIEQLNGQFESLQEPQTMEKGRMPVIMRPQAVIQWLFYLIWTYNLREADEGTNAYTGQVGKQFFGDRFTFRSTIDDTKLHAPLFTNDGIPTKNIDWLVKGVIKNMQADRYYARKINIEPGSVFNIFIEGDNTGEQEMMKLVNRGVILNNLWYIRPIDMKRNEWTGLTRDGVLYFENGKVQHAVTNFRWNEIFHEMTKRILALGPSVQIEHDASVPAMLIDDFNFVDVTTF
jgi:predicted Zn-dependent protease